MPDQTHPSPEELSAFNLGQLPPETAAAVEDHVSECEACCETLLGLGSHDTFVDLLKEARQAGDDESANPTYVTSTVARRTDSPATVPETLTKHSRYDIVRLIGKGGMGDVFEARHRMMDRAVALKVINHEFIRKPQAVDRFHREVKAAARLSHPNIVTAYDAEQAGDQHFLVMEYVDGVDLANLVKDRGSLSVAEACDFARQAAIGLQHAHEQGMVHRDIKPHNLMVTADGTVKILDFGLASLAPEVLPAEEARELPGELTAAGAIIGTPDFISPEQAQDAHQADIRSDIYSLGATLYFLLCGRAPFADASVIEKLKRHAEQEPVPLENLQIEIPEELADVIRKMMAKDPAERYQSPQEVADALAPFVDEYRSRTDDSTPGVETFTAPGWSAADRFAIATALITAGCTVLAKMSFTLPELFVVWIGGTVISACICWWNGATAPPRGLTARGWFSWGLSFALAGIIYIETGTGTVVIESIDEGVSVSIAQVTEKDHEGQDIQFVDTVTGSKIVRLKPGSYYAMIDDPQSKFELSLKGFTLSRGGKVVIKVTETESGEQERDAGNTQESGSLSRFKRIGRFEGHEGHVYHAIVSPDGKNAVSGGADKTIRIWDLETQEEIRVLTGHEGAVAGLAVSATGRLLASGDNTGMIRLWNLQTGASLGTLAGHEGFATDLAFLPDGRLLSAGFDETLRIWDVNEQKLLRTIDLGAKVEKMELLWDNRRVMLSGAHTGGWGVVTYDLEKGEKIDPQPSAESCLAVATDRRTALIGTVTGMLRVYDKETGKLIVQMAHPRANAARDAAILPGNRFAITTTRVGGTRLWNLEEGKLISSMTSDSIGTVTLSPDGRYALTIGREGGVTVWRLPDSVLPPMKPISSEPAASADLRENITAMIAAVRAAQTDEQMQAVVSGYTPILALLSQDAGGKLLELLADLPDELHETLLQKGYLRWKADELDAERRQVMLDLFAALLARSPQREVAQKMTEQIDAYAKVSDVGFKVIGVPESDSQMLVWYFLRRDIKVPTVLMLCGSSSTALWEVQEALNVQQINKQVSGVDDKSYTELPPAPVASREIRESLTALVNNLPDNQVSDEEWIEYLSEYSPFLADPKLAESLSRTLIRLLAGLPEESLDSLLDEGFVKWPFSKLDKPRQEKIRSIVSGVMSRVPEEHRDEKVTDLIDRILNSLATADVGFAVLELPDSGKQFVAFFAQTPLLSRPTILPVLGDLKDDVKLIISPAVKKQIDEILKQPDSSLPGSVETSNHALRFNGDDSAVSLPIRYDGSHPITLECTVLLEDHGERGRMLISDTHDAGINLQISPTDQKLLFSPRSEQQAQPIAWSRDKFPFGKKVHVAGVYTGQEVRLYLNGQLQETVPVPDDFRFEPSPMKLAVGANPDGPASFRQSPIGLIDEVRISKVARYKEDFTPVERFETDEDTLALYHFDEGASTVARDSSGNKLDAEIFGAKWTQWPKDKAKTVDTENEQSANHALEFDEEYSGVSLPVPYDGSHPLTIECRVRLEKSAYDRTQLLNTNMFRGPFSLNLTLPREMRLEFWWHTGGPSEPMVRSKEPFPFGETAHIAAVYTGKEIRLFVNGKLQGSQPLPPNYRFPRTTRSINSITIGSLPSGDPPIEFGKSILGLVDEIRISKVARYDKDFTPAERFETDEDTMALYHFDEDSSRTVRDSSANNRDGKNFGAKWVEWSDADSSERDFSLNKSDPTSLGFQWSRIPAGSFQMGTAENDVDALPPDQNWFFAGFLRSADRYSSHSPTLRSQWAGFRVVREPDADSASP